MFDPRPLCCSSLTTAVGGTKDTNIVDSESPYRGTNHGLPQLKTSKFFCEDCMMGKQHRNPFPHNSTWRASQILQLVQADICGPISTISNNNKKYLLTFIDDFSGKIWVFFLAEKSEAFECFKLFKVKVEKQWVLAFVVYAPIGMVSLRPKNSICFSKLMRFNENLLRFTLLVKLGKN